MALLAASQLLPCLTAAGEILSTNKRRQEAADESIPSSIGVYDPQLPNALGSRFRMSAVKWLFGPQLLNWVKSNVASLGNDRGLGTCMNSKLLYRKCEKQGPGVLAEGPCVITTLRWDFFPAMGTRDLCIFNHIHVAHIICQAPGSLVAMKDTSVESHPAASA